MKLLLLLFALAPITPDHLRPIPTDVVNPVRTTLENRLRFTSHTEDDLEKRFQAKTFPWHIPLALILLSLIYFFPKKMPKEKRIEKIKIIPSKSFEELSKFLRTHIEHKWKLPATNMTVKEINRSLPKEKKIIKILQKCDEAKFSKEKPKTSLQSLAKDSLQLTRE